MSEFNSEITSDDKLWGLLSWLFAPIVGVIVLLMDDKKNRPFLKYHAVSSIAFTVVAYVITTLTVGCGAVILLLNIWFAIKAYQGEYVTIPVITDFVKKQGWV
ncbi:MAG: hypothetical protein CVU44_12025 [Chloroflexi bacterium HGW-Chloroflexi-6]|nr:MAG: hypothetical protein CVU44_12025 [Chloroflexi bacterium HGW-Chloroflexi-6]